MTKALDFLTELAARRRFGMKPGLKTITEICDRLGHPEREFKAVHIAGTNGKGAVAAILDSVFVGGRYTSPHLMRLNERFFLRGRPVGDDKLERIAAKVSAVLPDDATFFEALTAVAFELYAQERPGRVILETGLGGRFDATNVCGGELSVITKIGLDHCDWLGGTIAEIAAEKAGIIKPGVPVVVGKNSGEALDVLEKEAKALGAPFFYAPDMVNACEIPGDFPLKGAFNRENAVTALAALKVLGTDPVKSLANVVWPGRFQEIGRFIVDGAHNPPAAEALASALGSEKVDLIAGFCADKDVLDVLRILSPHIRRAVAVVTNNPRSLSAQAAADLMQKAGMDAVAQDEGLKAALVNADPSVRTLVCGSLFLAGEAVFRLGAYPWEGDGRFDACEILRPPQR
jgi:dihydrofolate synthase/folylpolyglutamate synthase